jgi:2-dehydro-3-deoxygluconokinase
MAKLDIVALGEPMYEFSQIPGQQRHYLQGYGGDTMNCAIAAARQGAKVAYLTRLGDDEFGREFLELWRSEGIDTSGVGIDREAHTAVYFIRHGAKGHVFSYLRKGSAASRMTPDHLAPELIQSARFFHTSGITQAISQSACDTVSAAIEIARSNGVMVSFDANIRPRLWSSARARDVVGKTIPLTDFFLLSLEDAEILGAPKDRADIIRWGHDLGGRHVVLKLGPEGILASDRHNIHLLHGHSVTSVDATGAGDCCAGALLARLALGDDFQPALRYANAAAALTTMDYGAVAPLPKTEAVLEFLSAVSPSK